MDKNSIKKFGTWALIAYQPSSTNCGTCTRSSDFNEINSVGKCNLIADKSFNILKTGICRYHSEFKRNLI